MIPLPEDPPIAEYAHHETLEDTAWVKAHLDDPKVRLLEVDCDPTAEYNTPDRDPIAGLGSGRPTRGTC